MALTDKELASTYKDLLTLNNSNSGIPSNPTTIQDGNGSNTSISLGTKELAITPIADNAVFFVANF